MSDIAYERISKDYGPVRAVAPLDLRVESGEFFSLLGPSGSGKTTILRMTAGFLDPTAGRIVIGGSDITRLPPERRQIGVVFQNYALFPHLDVSENIAFGLRARKIAAADIARKVGGVLERTGLSGYEKRRPRELSGGEQQRVAIARALVIEPAVLLLDEPLGALDRLLREQMQYWIKAIQNEAKVTTIYVTHDQVEALTMSDRVAVLHLGEVEQVGKPTELYRHPATRFVATFMGDNNILDGRVVAVGPSGITIAADGDLVLVAEASDELSVGSAVTVSIRPEEIEVLPLRVARDDGTSLSGRVRQRIYRGPVNRYEVLVGPSDVSLHADTAGSMEDFAVGDEVQLWWPARSSAIVPGPRSS
jgi:putative spermidine/putrescine transport system ATP-binding protein